jgi:cytochrome c peroxidase
MHNGIFNTIEKIIEFYNSGAGEGNKAKLKKLGLTTDEKLALRAFLLEALTGDDLDIKRPQIP